MIAVPNLSHQKVLTIIQLSSLGLNLTFASSVSATAGEGAAVTYGVSQAVANLSGTAIFLIGFAWGWVMTSYELVTPLTHY